MKLKGLFFANLVLLSFAVMAPVAHVLSLPQRFALDDKMWAQAFGYFQHAWRVYAGAVAIAAFLASLVLFLWRRRNLPASLLSLNAVFAYAALTGLIFLSGATTDPHVVGFGLSILGWQALVGASYMVAHIRRP
ncbi:MAG: hypothetical protein ACOH12_14860 [Parvibaculaceae bacterium]